MSKAYSRKLKQKGHNLRKQGWTLGEISLKIKIPKNTLSGWVKDVPLTKNQLKRIGKKITDSAAIGRPLAVKINREKIEKWKLGIREKVKRFGQLAPKNPEIGKLICGLLYLCEGAKYPSTRCLIFGNTDPAMIRFFLNLLKTYFNIDNITVPITSF